MYQRYVKRIHETDQEIWQKIACTQLESELLRLKQSLKETYTISKKISESKGRSTEDILAALYTKDNPRLNIV